MTPDRERQPPQRLTILHVITRLILGGAQQNTIMSCAAQTAAGHRIALAFGPIYGPEGSLLHEAQQSGAELIEIPHMRREISPWHDVLCYRDLKRLIRRLRPDVVHTHSSKAGILGRAAAWSQRVPAVIHTVHGLPFHDRQPRWLHRAYVTAEKWAAQRCHHLIAITPAMRDAFAAQGIAPPQRFTVIPSGVDMTRFKADPAQRAAVRAELGIPPDAPVLGIVARLDPLKGHDDLLDIFPRLRERLPELRMVWIGDGWDRARLEARIRQLGAQDRVMLLGLVPHEQVARLLTAVDVKALPSYQEGQSRTLVEALMCGCGIVAYDAGGIGSICIDGQTGRLVPVGDRDALAQAILWMFEHPDQRAEMIQRGQAHVQARFDARLMHAPIEQVYRQVLGR